MSYVKDMVPTIERSARTDTGLAAELRLSVMRLRRRLANERHPDNELSIGQMTVLGALYRKGECTIGQLAEHERVRPPSMTRTINCLADDGYVVRRADDTDKRLVLVSLTERGTAIVLADRRRRDHWLAQRLRELTPDERAVLREAAPIQDRLVLQLHHGSAASASTALGITTGLQFLPILLLSPYAGLVADRFSKRRLLQLTQAWLGLSGLLLGGLAVTGVVEPWMVYAVAFTFGIGAAFGSGVRATGLVILVNAVSYLAVIGALQLMRTDELAPVVRAPRGKGMIRDGIRYVRSRPDLKLILVAVFFAGTFGMNLQMTSALMATQVFDKGPGEYGLLGSTLAIGSLTGALLGARRVGRPRLRLVILAGLAFGVTEVALGLMPTYLAFAAL